MSLLSPEDLTLLLQQLLKVTCHVLAKHRTVLLQLLVEIQDTQLGPLDALSLDHSHYHRMRKNDSQKDNQKDNHTDKSDAEASGRNLSSAQKQTEDEAEDKVENEEGKRALLQAFQRLRGTLLSIYFAWHHDANHSHNLNLNHSSLNNGNNSPANHPNSFLHHHHHHHHQHSLNNINNNTFNGNFNSHLSGPFSQILCDLLQQEHALFFSQPTVTLHLVTLLCRQLQTPTSPTATAADSPSGDGTEEADEELCGQEGLQVSVDRLATSNAQSGALRLLCVVARIYQLPEVAQHLFAHSLQLQGRERSTTSLRLFRRLLQVYHALSKAHVRSRLPITATSTSTSSAPNNTKTTSSATSTAAIATTNTAGQTASISAASPSTASDAPSAVPSAVASSSSVAANASTGSSATAFTATASANSLPVEAKRLTTLLEHTLSGLLKHVWPLLLPHLLVSPSRSPSSVGQTSVGSLADAIAQDLIGGGVDLLGMIGTPEASQSNSGHSEQLTMTYRDEHLSLLRYQTLLPSLLPTFLLYLLGALSTAHTSAHTSSGSLYRAISMLMTQLELVCRSELRSLRLKTLQQQQQQHLQLSSSSGKHTSKSKSRDRQEDAVTAESPLKDTATILNSNLIGPQQDAAVSDVALEETLFGRYALSSPASSSASSTTASSSSAAASASSTSSNASSVSTSSGNAVGWCYRLLKLCVALLVKLPTHPTSSTAPSALTAGQERVLRPLGRHLLWKHVLIRDTILPAHPTATATATAASSSTATESAGDLLSRLRAQTQAVDSVYRMLTLSKGAVNPNIALLHSIEEHLLDLALRFLATASSELVQTVTSRVYVRIVAFVKRISSQRSHLLSNDTKAHARAVGASVEGLFGPAPVSEEGKQAEKEAEEEERGWTQLLRDLRMMISALCTFLTSSCTASSTGISSAGETVADHVLTYAFDCIHLLTQQLGYVPRSAQTSQFLEYLGNHLAQIQCRFVYTARMMLSNTRLLEQGAAQGGVPGQSASVVLVTLQCDVLQQLSERLFVHYLEHTADEDEGQKQMHR